MSSNNRFDGIIPFIEMEPCQPEPIIVTESVIEGWIETMFPPYNKEREDGKYLSFVGRRGERGVSGGGTESSG
jgi:hypothetical protein